MSLFLQFSGEHEVNSSITDCDFSFSAVTVSLSDSERAMAFVEDETREGVRGSRRGERAKTDMDPEPCSHFHAQPRQPQLYARIESVCRHGEDNIIYS